MTMLLLKTHQEHMDQVRRHRMHATDGQPRGVKVGDWLLVQVTSGKPGNEVHRVRYAMRYRDCPLDRTGESKRAFGHAWKYLIKGSDFRVLRHPFDIETVKVSTANYGQGVIRFAYIDAADERVILERGLLEGA